MNDESKGSESKQRPYGVDLLKMIPPNLKVFDNVSFSSSQESDLSGPFSDFVGNEAFTEKRHTEDRSKMDIYTYFSFSEEFKSAMESVKKETCIAFADECKTDNGTDKKEIPPTKESAIHAELKKEVKALLSESEILFGSKAEIIPEIEDKGLLSAIEEGHGTQVLGPSKTFIHRPKQHDKKKVIQEEEEFYDTMSGYWRMLSAYDEFRISPPDYDAYDGNKPHWLETKPIPFDVTENSRKKCIDWLKENF